MLSSPGTSTASVALDWLDLKREDENEEIDEMFRTDLILLNLHVLQLVQHQLGRNILGNLLTGSRGSD